MDADFPYDVFLSHHQAAKPRVRRLAERLPLQLGTRSSELGIASLCLPPAALRSDWVGLERSTGGRGNLPFRDPASAGRRIIPLLTADAHRHEEPVAICDLESA